MHEDRVTAMDVMHQEDAVAQGGDNAFKIAPIAQGPALRRNAEQSLDELGFVALGLELADKPGSGIAERFIIEIDRVLGCQQQPHAEGPRLFD